MTTLTLERQRRSARALLRAARAGGSDAAEAERRFAAAGVRAARLALHHAQFVVARELGFTSWAAMQAEVLSSAPLPALCVPSLVLAATRAMEHELPRPLYRDPLARDLAGDTGMAIAITMRQATWPSFATRGPDPYLTIRSRYFDHALQHAVRTARLRQVVVIAAGTDTRAFRLSWPDGVTLFEIDRPEILQRKARLLRQRAASAHCRRRVVHADIARSWVGRLHQEGFDSRHPAAFLVESFFQYLDHAAANRLLREVTRLATPGSWIGLSGLSAAMLTSDFMRGYRQRMLAAGLPPWRFGVDDPEAWLRCHGWRPARIVAREPRASDGRWPCFAGMKVLPARPRGFFMQGWRSQEGVCA